MGYRSMDSLNDRAYDTFEWRQIYGTEIRRRIDVTR